MPMIPPNFNYGTELKNENPTLYNQLIESYALTARFINTKPTVYNFTSDPPADSEFNKTREVGDIYINTSSDTAWIMTSRQSNTAVTWTVIT